MSEKRLTKVEYKEMCLLESKIRMARKEFFNKKKKVLNRQGNDGPVFYLEEVTPPQDENDDPTFFLAGVTLPSSEKARKKVQKHLKRSIEIEFTGGDVIGKDK